MRNLNILLKEYRQKKGITQQELAQLLCVSYSTIFRWEKQGGKPVLALRRELEKLFLEAGCKGDPSGYQPRPPRKPLADIILEAAQELAQCKAKFSLRELFDTAASHHPGTNFASFRMRVNACALGHPARRYSKGQLHDYLYYTTGENIFKLNTKYLTNPREA